MSYTLMQEIEREFRRLQSETPDLYHSLNQFRDWLNQKTINYEIFLDDNWYDNKTIIEYTLRSLDTFDSLVFAEDEYLSSRDEKGVWHLGAYVKSYWTLENCWDQFVAFIEKNGPPRYKNP